MQNIIQRTTLPSVINAQTDIELGTCLWGEILPCRVALLNYEQIIQPKIVQLSRVFEEFSTEIAQPNVTKFPSLSFYCGSLFVCNGSLSHNSYFPMRTRQQHKMCSISTESIPTHEPFSHVVSGALVPIKSSTGWNKFIIAELKLQHHSHLP